MRHALQLVGLLCIAAVAAKVAEDRSWYVTGAMDSDDPWGNKVARWDAFTTTVDKSADSLSTVLAGTKPTAYASINVTVTASRPYSGNARLGLRVGSVSSQPSFVLTLTGAPYLGVTVFPLNKVAYDLTRAREHLSLDLILSTPNLVGFVKKFVRLYINGTDCGLYTYTEAPNDAWIDHHGLRKGSVYVAENFAFRNTTGLLKVSDKGYSATAFAAVLSPQTTINDGHAGVLELVGAIANASLSTVDLVARYFDEENLLTFLATQALLGNQDCVSRNYVLYRAYTGGAWLLLPYDFETAWRYYSKDLQAVFARVTPRWFEGVGGYFANSLYKRILESPYYVGRILGTANQLKAAAYNPTNAKSILTRYRDTVFAAIFTSPDQYRLPQAAPFTNPNASSSAQARSEWEAAFFGLADDLTTNYNNLAASLHYPAPGYTAVTKTRANAVYTFTWDSFVQPFGCNVATDLQFFADAALTQPVGIASNLQGTTIDVIASFFKPATTYFYRFINRASADPAAQYTEAFAPDFTTPDPAHAGYTLRYRAVNTFNTSATVVNATGYATTPAVTITNFQTVDGVKYATLDNANPADKTVGCQSGYVRIPDGWQVAPNDRITRAALKKANVMFGTRCVVLADGVAVVSTTGASCVLADPAVSAYLYDGGFQAGVGVKWCPMRVLLVDTTAGRPTACKNDGIVSAYSQRGAAAADPTISYTAFNDTRSEATLPVDVTPVIASTLGAGIYVLGGAGASESGVGGQGGNLYIKTTNEIMMRADPVIAPLPVDNSTTATTMLATTDMLASDLASAGNRVIVDGDLTTTGTQSVRTITARDIIINGNLRAGSTGAGRQSLTLTASKTVWIKGVVDVSGALGEDGATLTINAETVVIEGTLKAAGGYGALAGNGGIINIKTTSGLYFASTSHVNASGGDCVGSSSVKGGSGGNVRLLGSGGITIAGSTVLRGGFGFGRFFDARGGMGGNLSVNADGPFVLTGTFDARGGSAAAQIPGGVVVGGAGGSLNTGETIRPLNAYLQQPCDLTGGYGFTQGGKGGYTYFKPRSSHVYWYGSLVASGGASMRLGGAGGVITSFPGPDSDVSTSASTFIKGSIIGDGGAILAGGSGVGGAGGYLKVSHESHHGTTYMNESGLVRLDGGVSRGANVAGVGGMMYWYHTDGCAFLYGNLQARGGNALENNGTGGRGGFIYVFTDNDHVGTNQTAGILIIYESCVIDASGGNGTRGGDARNNGKRGSVRPWPSIQSNQDLVEDTAVLINNDGRHGPATGYQSNRGKILARGGVHNGNGGDVQYHGNVKGNYHQDPDRGYIDQSGDGTGYEGDWATL